MKKQTLRAWLYLLPAILFLGFFLVYPLIDVFVYSMEEGYNFASQTYFGTGFYNYSYVLHDPYFLQAVENTFLLVVITVPLSTGFALLISLALSSIKALRDLYQTVFFLPYVTNTLAVGMVFMVLFQKTEYTDGLINLMLHWFGAGPVDFISGPYWAKMFVLCFYTIWVVMPFKILILTSALASVNPDYYKAAKVDGTSKTRIFWKITVPMISPMIFYLIITGFIGAFKAYSDAVALFGTDLNEYDCRLCLRHALRGQRWLPVLCFRGGNPSVCDRFDDYLYQSSRKQKTCALLKGRPLWTKNWIMDKPKNGTGKKPELARQEPIFF